MQYFKLPLATCLFVITFACKRPDPIRLQPTIGEPPVLYTSVRMNEADKSTQLIRGFHELQEGGWRWAARKFGVALAAPPGAAKKGAWLVLNCNVPDVIIDKFKEITLTGEVAHTTLAPETIKAAGDCVYRREVPASAFVKDMVSADFTVDKSLTTPKDDREMALVVHAIALEPK